jgi:hypothetical protein
MLKVIEDEMKRFKNSNFTIKMLKMYNDILLLLPTSLTNVERFGNDFYVANTESLVIRKELQTYFLLSELYKIINHNIIINDISAIS